MSWKKISIPLALVLSLVLMLSLPLAAQQNVRLNILAMRMGSTEYIEAQTDEWIEQYEEEHDVNVSVNWEYLEEEDLRPQTVQDMAAGTGYYQIAQVGTQHLPLLAENDWIVPMEDYFTEDYNADEFVEAVVSTASYNDKMYVVPIYHEATHLIYRHDIFNELGIEVPETLEEVTEAAKKITEETDTAGIVLRGQRGAGLNHVSWKQYLQAFGGKWLESNEPPFEAAFNSEEGVEATEWYTNLIRNYAPQGTQTSHWRDVMSTFMAGEAAMTIDATSIGRRIVTDDASEVVGKTSFALFPEGPAGRYPWYFSWNLALSKVGTRNDMTREVAADYILWATSPEMKKEMMMEIGTLPARTSTLESAEAQEYYGQEGMSNWLENTIASLQIEEAGEDPVIAKIPQWPAIGDTIGIQLERIFTGSVSVEEGLDQAAKIINRDF
jgi:ABC-type glycerol-3-phosphate transport system substrate-binding protein